MKKRKIGKKILTAFLIILAVLIGAGAFYCYAPIIKNDVGDSGLIEKSTDENNLSIMITGCNGMIATYLIYYFIHLHIFYYLFLLILYLIISFNI